MNTNALTFLLLLSVSFVLSSGNEYQNLLTDFVSLHESMGAEKNDIGVLLARVRHANERQLNSLKGFKRIISKQCDSSNSRIKQVIATIKQNLNSAKNSLNQWTKTLVKARRARKAAAEQIKKTINEEHKLEEKLAKFVVEYQVVAKDGDEKLLLTRQLLDIITTELVNHAGSSFIQLKNFKEKLNELKSALNNSNESIYGPIVTSLLELATEQNFSDQSVLGRIVAYIKALRASVKKFRKEQESNLDKEVGIIRKQIKNAERRIEVYRRARNQAVSQVIDAKHYIKSYNHEIQHLTVASKTRVSEVRSLTKVCGFEKKSIKTDEKIAKATLAVTSNLFKRGLRLA